MTEPPLRTAISVMLDRAAPTLAAARAELDPAGAARIGLHITLLFPFVTRGAVTSELVEGLRAFFAARSPLVFQLTHVEEFPGDVAFVEPHPDGELKTLTRSLWASYPETPPYDGAFSDADPVPHATVAAYERTDLDLEGVRERFEPLLPVPCVLRAASLVEEYEPDRWRELASLPFGVGP